MVYRVPEEVIISETSSGMCRAAATVERKVDFAVLQVDSDEIHVLSVGQVENNAVRCTSLYFHTQIHPRQT